MPARSLSMFTSSMDQDPSSLKRRISDSAHVAGASKKPKGSSVEAHIQDHYNQTLLHRPPNNHSNSSSLSPMARTPSVIDTSVQKLPRTGEAYSRWNNPEPQIISSDQRTPDPRRRSTVNNSLPDRANSTVQTSAPSSAVEPIFPQSDNVSTGSNQVALAPVANMVSALPINHLSHEDLFAQASQSICDTVMAVIKHAEAKSRLSNIDARSKKDGQSLEAFPALKENALAERFHAAKEEKKRLSELAVVQKKHAQLIAELAKLLSPVQQGPCSKCDAVEQELQTLRSEQERQQTSHQQEMKELRRLWEETRADMKQTKDTMIKLRQDTADDKLSTKNDLLETVKKGSEKDSKACAQRVEKLGLQFRKEADELRATLSASLEGLEQEVQEAAASARSAASAAEVTQLKVAEKQNGLNYKDLKGDLEVTKTYWESESKESRGKYETLEATLKDLTRSLELNKNLTETVKNLEVRLGHLSIQSSTHSQGIQNLDTSLAQHGDKIEALTNEVDLQAQSLSEHSHKFEEQQLRTETVAEHRHNAPGSTAANPPNNTPTGQSFERDIEDLEAKVDAMGALVAKTLKTYREDLAERLKRASDLQVAECDKLKEDLQLLKHGHARLDQAFVSKTNLEDTVSGLQTTTQSFLANLGALNNGMTELQNNYTVHGTVLQSLEVRFNNLTTETLVDYLNKLPPPQIYQQLDKHIQTMEKEFRQNVRQLQEDFDRKINEKFVELENGARDSTALVTRFCNALKDTASSDKRAISEILNYIYEKLLEFNKNFPAEQRVQLSPFDSLKISSMDG